ncbi:peptidyl-prolyl cis-trans isomerase FKBP42-like [Pyrus ussuriensis x Pyrus communis]|uniref:Peptidyl-prolyl cis-trans isomerase FKBP42-like n=1 Tax=Pyrus ussuriensis x Pyrus communis TaxID=2448454 RepID=A0A5N5EW36_9ROSA|nr:peptidyl-prolyl cis-trans isomerase FKBP42-like [Pyrus ussuriensis x Pyrus communis]
MLPSFVGNLLKMLKALQKLIPRQKSFTRKLQSKSLRKVLVKYHPSIQHASVLAEDENDVKALFRRAKAKTELGQTDVAREDFLRARKFAPQYKAIARELRLLAEHDKAVYQKQKEICQGIFGPTPEPKPKRDNWLIIFWHWLLSLFCRLLRRERHKDEESKILSF